jgi:hypothetical protein
MSAAKLKALANRHGKRRLPWVYMSAAEMRAQTDLLDKHGAPMDYASIRFPYPTDNKHWEKIRKSFGCTKRLIAYAHGDDHWHIFVIGRGNGSPRYRSRLLKLLMDEGGVYRGLRPSIQYHWKGNLLQNLFSAGRNRHVAKPFYGADPFMKELDMMSIRCMVKEREMAEARRRAAAGGTGRQLGAILEVQKRLCAVAGEQNGLKPVAGEQNGLKPVAGGGLACAKPALGKSGAGAGKCTSSGVGAGKCTSSGVGAGKCTSDVGKSGAGAGECISEFDADACISELEGLSISRVDYGQT